jgi:ketosteroid isomerase-like protein
MKMRLLSTLAALAIVVAVPALAQEQNTVDPQVREQIEAVTKRMEEAYNKYDAAAWAAFYTQDAIDVWSYFSESAAVGLPAILKRYESEFASYPPKQSFKVVQVYAIGNEICAVIEYLHHQFHGTGRAVVIYVRDADEWKVRLSYLN